ncbi:hypothetical protein FM112_11455 [Gulosibacter sp. 10]|nr:hypothetical protein FM112_11455 [Gulosibacter sp. 10]
MISSSRAVGVIGGPFSSDAETVHSAGPACRRCVTVRRSDRAGTTDCDASCGAPPR